MAVLVLVFLVFLFYFFLIGLARVPEAYKKRAFSVLKSLVPVGRLMRSV